MSYLLDYNPGTPQWGYPRRGGAQLSGTAIIHTAECAMDLDGDDSSAEICASFIANRADYGSYHRLVDSDSIIELLPWEYEAWQDSETNNWAVGISAAVQAGGWNTIPADRRDRIYRNMAACAADFVRYMAAKGVAVPLRRITGTEARNRVPGFCAHGDSGISRTDPGAQFEWALFFTYTANALSVGTITAQGTTTPTTSEEDDMFDDHRGDQLDLTLDKANRAAGVLDSIEEPLHQKLLNVNRWVKGDASDTVYEIGGGKLRGISALEWELLGRPAPAVYPQSKIDDMPKEK